MTPAKMGVKASLDLHDIWIGVYWKREDFAWLPPENLSRYGDVKFRPVTTLYICLVPCVVIRIRWMGKEKK